MARLNNKRRRELRERLERHALAVSQNATTQAETGNVRSSTKPNRLNEAGGVPLYLRQPKPLDMGLRDERGRVTTRGGTRKLVKPGKRVFDLT